MRDIYPTKEQLQQRKSQLIKLQNQYYMEEQNARIKVMEVEKEMKLITQIEQIRKTGDDTNG